MIVEKLLCGKSSSTPLQHGTLDNDADPRLKTLPFKGLHTRTPYYNLITGRGFINQGSGLSTRDGCCFPRRLPHTTISQTLTCYFWGALRQSHPLKVREVRIPRKQLGVKPNHAIRNPEPQLQVHQTLK